AFAALAVGPQARLEGRTFAGAGIFATRTPGRTNELAALRRTRAAFGTGTTRAITEFWTRAARLVAEALLVAIWLFVPIGFLVAKALLVPKRLLVAEAFLAAHRLGRARRGLAKGGGRLVVAVGALDDAGIALGDEGFRRGARL